MLNASQGVLVECEEDSSNSHSTRNLETHPAHGVLFVSGLRMKRTFVQVLSAPQCLQSTRGHRAVRSGIAVVLKKKFGTK